MSPKSDLSRELLDQDIRPYVNIGLFPVSRPTIPKLGRLGLQFFKNMHSTCLMYSVSVRLCPHYVQDRVKDRVQNCVQEESFLHCSFHPAVPLVIVLVY